MMETMGCRTSAVLPEFLTAAVCRAHNPLFGIQVLIVGTVVASLSANLLSPFAPGTLSQSAADRAVHIRPTYHPSSAWKAGYDGSARNPHKCTAAGREGLCNPHSSRSMPSPPSTFTLDFAIGETQRGKPRRDQWLSMDTSVPRFDENFLPVTPPDATLCQIEPHRTISVDDEPTSGLTIPGRAPSSGSSLCRGRKGSSVSEHSVVSCGDCRDDEGLNSPVIARPHSDRPWIVSWLQDVLTHDVELDDVPSASLGDPSLLSSTPGLSTPPLLSGEDIYDTHAIPVAQIDTSADNRNVGEEPIDGMDNRSQINVIPRASPSETGRTSCTPTSSDTSSLSLIDDSDEETSDRHADEPDAEPEAYTTPTPSTPVAPTTKRAREGTVSFSLAKPCKKRKVQRQDANVMTPNVEHAPKRVYRCSACGYVAASQYYLRLHRRPSLPCPIANCPSSPILLNKRRRGYRDKWFCTTTQLERHIKRHPSSILAEAGFLKTQPTAHEPELEIEPIIHASKALYNQYAHVCSVGGTPPCPVIDEPDSDEDEGLV